MDRGRGRGSNYDYHFIIKKITEEFEGEYNQMSHTHHSKHMSHMYHINCTNHGNYTHHMNHTDQRHHARDKKNIRQINRVNYMHYMNLISIRQLCDITATVNTAFQRGPSKISKSLPPLMLIINRNSVFKIIVYRRTDVLDI